MRLATHYFDWRNKRLSTNKVPSARLFLASHQLTLERRRDEKVEGWRGRCWGVVRTKMGVMRTLMGGGEDDDGGRRVYSGNLRAFTRLQNTDHIIPFL